MEGYSGSYIVTEGNINKKCGVLQIRDLNIAYLHKLIASAVYISYEQALWSSPMLLRVRHPARVTTDNPVSAVCSGQVRSFLHHRSSLYLSHFDQIQSTYTRENVPHVSKKIVTENVNFLAKKFASCVSN